MDIGAVVPKGRLGEGLGLAARWDRRAGAHGGARGAVRFGVAAVVAALVGIGASGGVAPAAAFELKRDPSGATVRWNDPEVAFVIDARRAQDVDAATATRSIKAAFAAWSEVLGPRLRFRAAGDTHRPVPGFNREPGAANENAVIFSREAWPFEGSEALMMTVTTYRSGGAGMVDADIVVNERDHQWGDGRRDRNDLQNALTHEVGHLLGLGHSLEPTATMYARASVGEVHKRDPHADDRAAIDALYGLEGAPPPPAQDAEEALDPPLPGCAQAPGSASPGVALLLGLGLLFGCAGRRRPRAVRLREPGVSGGASAGQRWLARLAGLAGLVGLAGLMGGGEAQASSLEALSVAELGARSTLVAEGVVIARRSAWEGQLIFTETTVAVQACWAGTCPAVLRLRTPGGAVDDLVMAVDGVAALALGEAVVVFAAPSEVGAERHRVVGHALGKYSVVAVDGAVHALRDLREVHLIGPGRAAADGESRLQLADLRRQVRADFAARAPQRLADPVRQAAAEATDLPRRAAPQTAAPHRVEPPTTAPPRPATTR